MKPAVVVVGSLNMDIVVRVESLPAPGETVLGQGFQMIPGGKGANQAAAAARLGLASTHVKMIGRVGFDPFADHLRASLSAAGVDVTSVHSSRSQPTGVALIAVDRAGQNSIVVASGANMELEAEDVEAMRRVFRGARVALFQLESPLPTVHAALRIAREEGLTTILDPAPAQGLPPELLQWVDILTPNESEALALLGHRTKPIDLRSAAAAIAEKLSFLGAHTVILKLGAHGCLLWHAAEPVAVPGFAVDPVDTTAAGDTFNGALAVALAEGSPLPHAVRFANAAAALSVTRAGAQSSIPSRSDVDQLLAEQRPLE